MPYEPSLAVARFLPSTEGETWLDRAAQVTNGTVSELAVVSYLRQRLSRDQAAAVIEQLLDKRIAYLSSNERVLSPFVSTFRVEEELPYGLKPIRRRLRNLDVGVLEIKKLGVAWDPDDLRRRLKVTGNRSMTLILTRIGTKPVAFLCRREKN